MLVPPVQRVIVFPSLDTVSRLVLVTLPPFLEVKSMVDAPTMVIVTMSVLGFPTMGWSLPSKCAAQLLLPALPSAFTPAGCGGLWEGGWSIATTRAGARLFGAALVEDGK